ncbi:hypothetical protein [Argonema antarcticum]|uniref:hypothetical protein n=1 Tax=Argonema antarcticum TaxID=2942763 RepID=UPI0020115A49|nr:hypothetical protein [Argonema antarcticum]MCL1471127.1 hypothetical protein [Argonema antarcticum A004/B2]
MPVNILYCEGVSKSPDLRVLSVILPPGCVVKPIGSKQGLSQRILGARDVRSGSIIKGLKDRDFDDDDSPPTGTSRIWYFTENNTLIQIGWYWERKEIENYLLDPKVVNRSLVSLAPPLDKYRAALQTSAEKIAAYTAARIALSLYLQNRPSPPNNFWGEERDKKEAYRFPRDKALAEGNCRSEVNNIVRQYSQRLSSPQIDVISEFERLLPTCCPGGSRFQNQNFLQRFAGKDLLYGMQDALRRFGFESPVLFRERVLKGIEDSGEDVWTWLPEWQRLRELIAEYVSE